MIKLLFENRIATLIAAFVMIVLIGYLDLITATQLSFSLHYLIPICLVTWCVGLETGIIFAAFASLIWISIEYFSNSSQSALLVIIWNTIVTMSFFSIIAVILSRLKMAAEKESRLARIDFLTGMSNNYDFNEYLLLEMERARRYKRSMTLAYIDCDDFKKVNDEQGHEQGDLLLKEVANILMHNVRKTDQSARLGGDEFIVLLPETNEDQAREIFLRLHVKLLTIMELYQWPVTFSIGCITFEDIPLTTKDAIKEADRMMYQAKENGKNQLATKTIHSIIKKT